MTTCHGDPCTATIATPLQDMRIRSLLFSLQQRAQTSCGLLPKTPLSGGSSAMCPCRTGSVCLACIPCSPALSDPAGAGTCGCRRVPIRRVSSTASTAYHSAVWPSAQLALPWQQAQRWKRRMLTSFSGECWSSLLHPLLFCGSTEAPPIIPFLYLCVALAILCCNPCRDLRSCQEIARFTECHSDDITQVSK